jgi:hypothetical protein
MIFHFINVFFTIQFLDMQGNTLEQLVPWHHFSLHPCPLTPFQFLLHHTSIKCILPVFPKRLRTKPKPQVFFWFFQACIPTHAPFIDKWSFRDGFWTFSKLFSPKKFNKWILKIVSTLFSYHSRSHSTLNCTCPWSSPLFNRDQAFRWSSSHCNGGNIILIHKLHLMCSIVTHL